MADGDGVLRYSIDAEDRIVFVDEAWQQFAAANGGDDVMGSKVIGRSLWEFISDDTTRALYRQIIARAREGQGAEFTLHCDGPSEKRLLEMSINAGGNNVVHFSTTTLRIDERDAVAFFARNTLRAGELVRMCAWCNRVDVGEGDWVEVEDADARLRLAEGRVLPPVTHGICEDCLATMTETLDHMESRTR